MNSNKSQKSQLNITDVMPSLSYDIIIIEQGNGEWFHGFENPLQHRWYTNGNRSTCLVCGQIIEKQIQNKISKRQID